MFLRAKSRLLSEKNWRISVVYVILDFVGNFRPDHARDGCFLYGIVLAIIRQEIENQAT